MPKNYDEDYHELYEFLRAAKMFQDSTPEEFIALLKDKMEKGFPIDYITSRKLEKSEYSRESLLFHAIRKNLYDFIIPMLELGANPNLIDVYGKNALINLANDRDVPSEVFKAVLKKTKNIVLQDNFEFTAMDYLCGIYVETESDNLLQCIYACLDEGAVITPQKYGAVTKRNPKYEENAEYLQKAIAMHKEQKKEMSCNRSETFDYEI